MTARARCGFCQQQRRLIIVNCISVSRFSHADCLLSACFLCSGDVVSEETYNKCIKPDGEFKGKRVGPKDIIRLQGGGTGYAARDGEKAQVQKHFSLGEWVKAWNRRGIGTASRIVQHSCRYVLLLVLVEASQLVH
jgi:hypothetical protein